MERREEKENSGGGNGKKSPVPCHTGLHGRMVLGKARGTGRRQVTAGLGCQVEEA